MERFNPCTTESCKEQCDSMGVHCEEICILEIERLRGLISELLDTELKELACTGSHAPVEDILGRMADAVPNAEITGRTLAQNEADGA